MRLPLDGLTRPGTDPPRDRGLGPARCRPRCRCTGCCRCAWAPRRRTWPCAGSRPHPAV